MRSIRGMVDNAALVTALERLGLSPPCHLMVHASLSALGVVEGGAETVVSALREVAGREGAPAGPSGSPPHPATAPR